MTVIKPWNPGQVPIITYDQPLANQIQWNLPTTHGENNLVVMFGGLHIKMAALKMPGDLLEGSGSMDRSTVQDGITTPGI